MQTIVRSFPLAIAIALVLRVGTAQADIGLNVVAQRWDPRVPDQTNNVTLVNNPSGVSDGLQLAWADASPRICAALQEKMGLGGAANGQTLRNITCALDSDISVTLIQVNATTLRATALINGYVEATSTTPDIALGIGVGEEGDPRFSVAISAKLDMNIAVQANREQTLRVTQATFTLSNATLDSQNFSGDMLKFLASDLIPFFGGPNYKQLAENAINAVSGDVTNQINGGMSAVNRQLAGPPELVRSELVVQKNELRVAYAPPRSVPRTEGRMTGVLRWDPANFTPKKGCNSFIVAASVQVGPAPVFLAGGAPMQALGAFQASPNDASSCTFVLSGIASDWPNRLASQVLDSPVVNANTNYRTLFSLAPDGWPGTSITPPVADARNYLVKTYTLKTPPLVDARDTARRDYRNPEINRDPRINTEVQIDRPAPLVKPAADAARLNPQPLPPVENPSAARDSASARKIAPAIVPLETPIKPKTIKPIE